jgi:hypothetical protein
MSKANGKSHVHAGCVGRHSTAFFRQPEPGLIGTNQQDFVRISQDESSQFVAGGSLAPLAFAPATKEAPMAASDDFLEVVDEVLIEIEDIKRQTDRRQAKDESSAGAENFEFRPLTEEEKQEFVNSLNEEGKQILAELAPKAKR